MLVEEQKKGQTFFRRGCLGLDGSKWLWHHPILFVVNINREPLTLATLGGPQVYITCWRETTLITVDIEGIWRDLSLIYTLYCVLSGVTSGSYWDVRLTSNVSSTHSSRRGWSSFTNQQKASIGRGAQVNSYWRCTHCYLSVNIGNVLWNKLLKCKENFMNNIKKNWNSLTLNPLRNQSITHSLYIQR